MINHPYYPNGNIYLSGGMQYANNLGASWREECSTHLKGMGYNPIDITALDKAYSAAHGHPYMFLEGTDLLQYKSNIRHQIVRADIELVRNYSDALIVYFDEAARAGAGTQSECQEASDHDVPYFLVNGFKEWKVVPGWIRANSTKMFSTFDDLYTYLGNLPAGILKRDIYGNRHINNQYLCGLCGDPFKKNGLQFVSKLTPIYCKTCVDVVKKTNEQHYDRLTFFIDTMQAEANVARSTAKPRKLIAGRVHEDGSEEHFEDFMFEVHRGIFRDE